MKATNVVANNMYKKTHWNRQVYRCVFLLSIFYLLKNTINIIKANTIIVSTTNANKSKYIISNKIASIIAPPPYSQINCGLKVANHICYFSFSMNNNIQDI